VCFLGLNCVPIHFHPSATGRKSAAPQKRKADDQGVNGKKALPSFNTSNNNKKNSSSTDSNNNNNSSSNGSASKKIKQARDQTTAAPTPAVKGKQDSKQTKPKTKNAQKAQKAPPRKRKVR
jgi:hypothetical protein